MRAQEQAIGGAETAADLMLGDPKTLPADALVADVRAALADPHVELVLLTDGRKFRGAVAQVPADADPEALALDFAEPNPETIGPAAPAATAFLRARASARRRVVVLDEQQTLLGLLCLNRTHTRFCGAAANRRAEP